MPQTRNDQQQTDRNRDDYDRWAEAINWMARRPQVNLNLMADAFAALRQPTKKEK